MRSAEQGHRVDRRPGVRELDQDRLEGEAEHADDGGERPDQERAGPQDVIPTRTAGRNLLSIPAHPARVRRAEYHEPEGDAIPRERNEVVMGDVAE